MGKIICFISDDFTDFEITLAFHKIKNVGKVQEAMKLEDIEGLIIPGGPIREQSQELTDLLIKPDKFINK